MARAFSELGTGCANLDPNSACYGFEQVTAAFADPVTFDSPGDRAELTTLQTIATTELNSALGQWGMAVMNVQANIPNGAEQSAVFLMLGEVEVTNVVLPGEAFQPADPPLTVSTSEQANIRRTPGLQAHILGTVPVGTLLQADSITPDGNWVRVLFEGGPGWVDRGALDPATDFSGLPLITVDSLTPLQAFKFRTGTGSPECPEAPPSVLVVQSPEGVPVDLIVNGAPMRVEGTVFLRTLDSQMEAVVGDGETVFYPEDPNQSVLLQVATSVRFPLDGEGNVDGRWSNWRLLSQGELNGFAPIQNIPNNVWNTPYVPPTIVMASGVGGPIPVVETPDGVVIPVPPPRRVPFPIIDLAFGERGEGLPQPAWIPVSIGDAVCPPWVFYHSDRDGDWDVYRLDVGASNNVSQGPGSADIQPTYSQDAEWVTFTSNRAGESNWEIWLARADGTEQQRLTYNTATDINPVWGPDGLVIFESNRDGDWELYLADVMGSAEPLRLTHNPASDINAFWSRDGDFIVFQTDRDGDWEIFMLEFGPAGSDFVELVGQAEEVRGNQIVVNGYRIVPAGAFNPRDVNPGDWVIVTGRLLTDGTVQAESLEKTEPGEVYTDIRQRPRRGNRLIRLTRNDTEDQVPVLSEDGTQMAWLRQNAYGTYDLWLMDLTTGEIRQLTDTGTNIGGHVFAPDGTFLAYHTNLDGDYDVFALEIASGLIKALTVNDVEDRAPGFRCESPMVIYHSASAESVDNPGQRELFEVNPLPLDGTPNTPTRLTFEEEADDIYVTDETRDEINSRDGRIPIHLR